MDGMRRPKQLAVTSSGEGNVGMWQCAHDRPDKNTESTQRGHHKGWSKSIGSEVGGLSHYHGE